MNRFKKYVLFTIGLALVIAMSGMAQDKPSIVVLDFRNKTNTGGYELGRGASDMLTTALFKTKKFEVIERERLNTLIKEQSLSATGIFDAGKAAQIGKLVGAQYIVIGSITEYGHSRSSGGGGRFGGSSLTYSSTVDIRIINVSTGKIVFADSGTGSVSSHTVRVFGHGGGESYNEKNATQSLRDAINDVCEKIKKEGLSE